MKQLRSAVMVTIIVLSVLTLSVTRGTPTAAAADLIIYNDSLSSGWQNWSWSTTANFSAASPVYSGTRSLAVTFTSGWAGLYLAAVPVAAASSYDTLQFRVHGGSQGGQKVRVVPADGGYNLLPGQGVDISVIAGTWTQVKVPLASLGGLTQVGGIVWQDTSGGAQPVFYLDSISLTYVGYAPPPPVPGPDLSIDASSERHIISADIYGMNFADEALAAKLKLPVRRWGGNSTTRYNWTTNMHNVGSDWFFENIPDGSPVADGSASDLFVEQNRRTGTGTIMTVPLIGWTPKGSSSRGHPYECAFKVSQYGAQQSTDPYDSDCGNGVRGDGSDITGNDPTDTSNAITPVFVTDWILHLTAKYGLAKNGGVGYYNLDNEPMLWNSTHRDVHPQPTGYDELRDRTVQYAAAIKNVDPDAKTLGPVLWGWCAYFYSAADGCGPGADYTSHGSTPFVPWYLQRMQAYEQTNAVRILDYLDLHYYPQASGVALSSAGSTSTQALRLRSTRSLWDASYIDESWISDTASGGVAVRLIPRMKEWVNTYYKGTKLAITEYNWGALNHINGALAQADVLGIFGREGLDLATLWGPPAATDPGAFSFLMYRNYDGAGSGFGELSVKASSTDQSNLAVYAAQRGADEVLTVMVINKSANSFTSNVSVTGFTPTSTAAVYRYSAANFGAVEHAADQAISGQSFSATFPAGSITLLAMPPESGLRTLTAKTGGTGSGTLSSTTAGVTCSGSSCSGSLSPGTSAMINAAAAVGSTFSTWTGCTSVSGSQCTVLMDAGKTVTATFNLIQYTLKATASGTGTGSVASSPAGISFTYPSASTGTAAVSHGTSVVLTATATGGGTAVWSGNCDATGGTSAAATCTINSMNADKNVAAAFTAPLTGIAVTAPNGGEIWKVGSAKTISWTYTGNPGSSVKVELLKAGKLSSTISKKTTIGTAGKGSVSWTVPRNQTAGSDYTIRVTSTTNSSYTDVSNAVFTISK